MSNKPTPAFIGASYFALSVGIVAFLTGLWNAGMLVNEKGFYFILLMYGLFSTVSLQKSVRDKSENIKVTDLYYGLCWASVVLCLLLICIGLWRADLLLSEKGFYLMSFLLSLFGAICVQKNTRDVSALVRASSDGLNKR